MSIYYKKILKKYIKKNISLSVVESCTGGKIANEITKIPGISKIFSLGLVTYSNYSKIKILKIKKNNLIKYGSVSREIAKEMVVNLRNISGSNCCISTTGIAGPDGSTRKKPVGLIYIAVTYKNKVIVYKKNFKGTRIEIQRKITKFVFSILNKILS